MTRARLSRSGLRASLGAVLALLACVSPAQRAYDLAQASLQTNDYDGAIARLEEAVTADPGNGEYRSALDRVRRDAADASARSAAALLERGELLGAEEGARRAAVLDPANAQHADLVRRIEGELERKADSYAEFAENLLGHRGRQALAHAALLYAEANRLAPRNEMRASRSRALSADAIASRSPRIRTTCAGQSEEWCAQFLRSLRTAIDDLGVRDVPAPSSRDAGYLALDLAFHVSAPQVQSVRLGNRRERSSSYLAGYIDEPNPAYPGVLAEFNAAIANYNYWNLLSAAAPSVFNSGALVGASIRVGNARSALQATPATVRVPQYEPYSFREYELRGLATITGHVRIAEIRHNEILLDRELKGRAEVSRALRLGVRPDDSTGVTEDTVELRSDRELATRAWGDLERSLFAAVRESLGSAHADLASRLRESDPGFSYELLAYRALRSGDLPPRSPSDEVSVGLTSDFEFTVTATNLPAPRRLAVSGPARKGPHSPSGGATAISVPADGSVEDMLASCERAVVSIDAGRGEGSGFFVDGAGTIVTNAHVVEGARNVVVRTRDGQSYLARVLAADIETDLAFLAVDASRDYLSVSGEGAIRVGAEIFAIGFPLKLGYSVTRGIVSQLQESEEGHSIQHDAALNPGNSGGPLLNRRGHVVGVNKSKGVHVEIEGLSFAVSGETVRATAAKRGIELPAAPVLTRAAGA